MPGTMCNFYSPRKLRLVFDRYKRQYCFRITIIHNLFMKMSVAIFGVIDIFILSNPNKVIGQRNSAYSNNGTYFVLSNYICFTTVFISVHKSSYRNTHYNTFRFLLSERHKVTFVLQIIKFHCRIYTKNLDNSVYMFHFIFVVRASKKITSTYYNVSTPTFGATLKMKTQC